MCTHTHRGILMHTRGTNAYTPTHTHTHTHTHTRTHTHMHTHTRTHAHTQTHTHRHTAMYCSSNSYIIHTLLITYHYFGARVIEFIRKCYFF